MGLETGWNCHISLTPNGDVPGSEIPPSSPSHAGSLHDDLHQGERTAPKPLWMPRVSRMVLLNPFIGSCVLTRYLILQSFEHKAGWAWGVCMCEWERLTFIASLPSQYRSYWKQTSFCAPAAMILQLLIITFGSCWGPGQATEGQSLTCALLFSLSGISSLSSSPRKERTDTPLCLKAETMLTYLPLSRLVI